MRVVAHRLPFSGSSVAVFSALFRGDDHAWWLDSALADGDLGRFSFMGSAAGPLARVAIAEYGRPGVVVRDRTGSAVREEDLLTFVERDLAAASPQLVVGNGDEMPFAFRLGWIGYLGYELGMRMLTGLDVPDDTPEAVLVFADRSIVIDHLRAEAWVLALLGGAGATADAHTGVEPAQRSWVDATVTRLRELDAASPENRPDSLASDDASAHACAPGLPAIPPGAVSARHDRATYLDLVRRCLEYIAAGDSYELCLTNRVTVQASTDPWALYRRLRDTSPRPFAAYLAFGRRRVLSASPERFLSVGADGLVEAKPIKGTRPRGRTECEDRRLAAELASDTKELAENLMIVDLLRNDLSRVCRPGTVHVPKLFDVETYAGVHQLVSTARGRLRDGVTAVDAFRSAFPGGSMTGAPKDRSVRILRSLEDGPRGVYSGAIGYFSFTGAADWSIVIRSIVWHPDHLTYGIGGAVTAGSDPEAEWMETVVKARTLGSALGVDLDRALAAAPRTGPRTFASSVSSPRAAPASPHTSDATHAPVAASFLWSGGRLVLLPEANPPGELLVADSWRCIDGRVRRLDLHRARFATSVARGGAPKHEAERFVDAAAAAVPPEGEWFPRLRLIQRGSVQPEGDTEPPSLVLDVRPGPERHDAVRVQVLQPGDPRSSPWVKGPDMALSARLVAQARRAGADEVLIRDDAARVLEAGYAALVWWEGDTLVGPSRDLAVLPSVTRTIVEEHARRLGVLVRAATVGLEALDGREAWLLSAYQGLRLVSAWIDADITPGPGERFADWRAALEAM